MALLIPNEKNRVSRKGQNISIYISGKSFSKVTQIPSPELL